MYEKLDRSGGRTLGYEIRDRISEDELQEILREMEAVIHDEGEVRVLVYIPTFPSFEIAALDDDLGFWFQHRDDLERYAIVGDNRLVEWASDLGDRLVGTDIRYFDEHELDDAWAWVQAQANE
jgi:hypothetical protein